MGRSRILLRLLRQPERRDGDLISADEDCCPIRQPGGESRLRHNLRRCPVKGTHAGSECVMHHGTQLLFLLTRESVIEDRLRDLPRRLHGRVLGIVIRLALLLTLRRLRVLEGFRRLAPTGLELVHHPCRRQSTGGSCNKTLPEMSFSVVHFRILTDSASIWTTLKIRLLRARPSVPPE